MTDVTKRAKCRRELKADRYHASCPGSWIQPAKDEWEVACFLWGLNEANRLYPSQRRV